MTAESASSQDTPPAADAPESGGDAAATQDTDFASYGGDDEDLEDDGTASPSATAVASATAAAKERQKVHAFDLAGADTLSFAVLLEARAKVFFNDASYRAFTKQVEELADSGEPRRRKGLGYWVLAEYERAVEVLAQHEGDDVADFTRAKSLVALGRPAEAEPLFRRLSEAYPDEPRPRGGAIDAKLRTTLGDTPGSDVSEEQVAAVVELLDAELSAAPASFAESAEGHYLTARKLELERRFEQALDHYSKARELDITLRDNLVRGAYLAERCGLDYMAVDLYEALVEQHLADRGALMNLGVLYEDMGRDEDAAACYDTIVQQFPTDGRARRFLEDARSAMDMYYDEDLERKEDKLNQILRIPITDFELSVRARNCLNKMQIHTLGDLVTKTEQELMSYKNFGETSLNEIKEILRSKGLRLGMPREEAVASIESRSRRTTVSSDPSDLSNKPVADLQLSIRARRTVEALGCLTVADICKHSADELLGMPNFGTTSLQELRSKLSELGAKLAGE